LWQANDNAVERSRVDPTVNGRTSPDRPT